MSEQTPSTLDPLRFPLHGSRLIEASAGTGKTYTIAALYLRLVLGAGDEHAFARPLTPPEILVVTFTEAATQELRDRIRALLAEAAAAFQVDPAEVPAKEAGEDLLHDLRGAYAPEAWPACARKLQLAAEWMDEAAVSTIHGWCNRMLREHAFDSDSLFTQRLEPDQSELLAEAVRDYWRICFYPLGPTEAAAVQGWWPTPRHLEAALQRLLEHTATLGPGVAPDPAVREAQQQAQRELAALKQPWAAWAGELQQLLDAAVDAKQVNGVKLKKNHYSPWLDALRAWAASPELVLPELTKAGWTRLTPTGLAEAWKTGSPPDHPALQAMATLRMQLEGLPDAREDVLRHAARWVAGRFAAEQERRAQMGFNDLLTRLDAALRGPNGERLASLIRAQFPVALIDEFQDTDPLQYRIFSKLYLGTPKDHAQDHGPRALILIGDPKQAIYAFRGADIHTYLAARRDTGGRHYTLGTNYRSSTAMVAAVNHCFAQAEQREAGQGAFLFREASAGNPLPFVPVGARGRAERWQVEGREAPALTCWWLDDGSEVAKGSYLERMAAAGAAHIVRLLQGPDTGFVHAGGRLQRVQPGDVAVLVNTGREAAVMREALAQRGVRSVYLSDQDSVFRCPGAAQLQRWLAACAEPDDDRLLRAALATAHLGLDWAALDRLNQDELAWEARVLQFRAYRQCWQRQGVLPMLRRLLADFAVPRRLLAAGDERSLTDLLHLAELLQQASTVLDGEHALIRHLAEQREDAQGGNDARRLRLESDDQRVKVVTVHKSKGLEYPLVFLPFACAFRATAADDLPLKWHDEQGGLQLALSAGDGLVERAEQGRLGEDLRKLYVALTRARHATWVGLMPLRDLHCSALGYLLAGGGEIPPGALEAALRAFQGGCEAIHVEPVPPMDGSVFRPADAALPLAPELPLDLPPREPWWIASYSALQVGAAESAHTAAEDTYSEGLDQQEPGPPAPAPAGTGLHTFPRGPGAGSFLHGLLEWAGRQGFARVRDDPAMAQDLIARRCNLRGWSHWVAPLTAWLLQCLDTPLRLPDAPPLQLAGLDTYQVEMEFWFAARQADARRLDSLVHAATLGGAPRPALLPTRMNGMLKGFIDLVFAHQGRYYVMDYKSNWLGPTDPDYTPAAMRAAVLDKRYDLQYVLYLFALHRLLRSRLPGYDYEQHVGGAAYLFLRGSGAASQGLHHERPPGRLMEELDALFGGGSP